MNDNLANTMPFSQLMGVNVTEATIASVIGEIDVREDLCTTRGVVVMAYRITHAHQIIADDD